MIHDERRPDEVFYVVKEGALEITQKFSSKMVAEQQMAGMASTRNVRVVVVDAKGREILLG
jgi:hypothetical protein